MAYVITTSDTKANFAIKAKYPTRKAAERILSKDKDNLFVDQVISCTPRQVRSWLNTAQVSIMDEQGAFYPVDSKNVQEQFDLVVAGETPTVAANPEFGVLKIEHYITDPITGGETEESDVLGKKLGDIQENVSISNGVITVTLKYVTDYTGFNGEDATEQNGYYLVFYANIGTMPDDASYSDIKFSVVGGTGKEVTLDEGMNIIFLGATKEEALGKTLKVTAHLTVVSDSLGELEKDVEAVFVNKLNYVDMEELITNKAPEMEYTPVRRPSYDTTLKFLFLNGNAATIYAKDGYTKFSLDETGEIIDIGQSLAGWVIYGGGRGNTHYAKTKITMLSGTVATIMGGGLGDGDSVAQDKIQIARVDNAEIIVNGGTVTNTVAGGGGLSSIVKYANVTINGGTFLYVIGGGFAHINNNLTVQKYFAKNPENSTNIVNEAVVNINGGKFNNNHCVYGGAQGYGRVDNTVVNVNKVEEPITNGWYIAAGSNGYCKEGTININCDNEINVTHTHNRGWCDTMHLNVYKGIVKNLYPIQEEADNATATMEHHGCVGSSTVYIAGGTVKNIGNGYNYQTAVAANDPKVIIYVSKKATVENLEDAKTAFGTSLTVLEN